jgi:hypothetical protein
MTTFVLKLLGIQTNSPNKQDDFSQFFIDTKSREKTKVLKKVLQEATKEQEIVLKKYREIITKIV